MATKLRASVAITAPEADELHELREQANSDLHLGRALDRLYKCEDEISRAIREAVT